MNASEVIAQFKKDHTPIRLPDGNVLEAAKHAHRNALDYAQFGKCFGGAVHYEIGNKGNSLSVLLDDERIEGRHRDPLRVKLAELAKAHGLTIPEKIGARFFHIDLAKDVNCEGKSFEQIAAELGERFNELYQIFNETLSAGNVSRNVVPVELPPMAERPQSTGRLATGDVPIASTFSWVSTIGDLFGRKPFSPDGSSELFIPGDYVIPVYQRKYTWTVGNVSTLCRDLLKAAAESKPSYHLGTIIIHADRESGDFFVVDGQQRLRTISRLLSQKIFREMDGSPLGRRFTGDDELRIWRTFMRFGEEDRNAILGMLRKSTVVCIAVGDVSEAFQLFSTQNGRGKPLSPENLLKAFHFHELGQLQVPAGVEDVEEYRESRKDEIDEGWESLNASRIAGEERNLLGQVMGEHLYRIRCWLHGTFPDKAFSAKDVSEFKGLTLWKDADGKLPVRNLASMRIRNDGVSANGFAVRSIGDQMKPFDFIDQPIANGADFFEYVQSCCQAYKNLFMLDPGMDLIEFRRKYRRYCLYVRSGRRGDTYARHVFQSLCMYCYDRFGADAVTKCFNELYCCAYYERAVNGRCYYQTCGREFSVRAVQAMASASTLAALKDRLCELSFNARDRFDASGADGVEGLEMVYEIFDGGVENV